MAAGSPLPPVAALRRIAFHLERAREATHRVKAFRHAADALDAFGADNVATLVEHGRLRDVKGIGEVTAKVVEEALRGERPTYLARLEADQQGPVVEGGEELRAALRGDCHSHSDWSDGGSPIREMAETARELGHEYLVLTDHSGRLTIAHGLDETRLRDQLDVVAAVNEEMAPFRLLTGMEVDILDDGSLDMSPDLLGRLDVVVASVHSKLRMESRSMTRRMVNAMRNPHADILGHCTGRMVTGRGRPPSEFDADAVFAACADNGKAVEINCRPERLDPPRPLLRAALDHGCVVSIDTDAHAPGQLDWQPYGCRRAEEVGVTADRVVNSWPVGDLLAWTAGHAG